MAQLLQTILPLSCDWQNSQNVQKIQNVVSAWYPLAIDPEQMNGREYVLLKLFTQTSSRLDPAHEPWLALMTASMVVWHSQAEHEGRIHVTSIPTRSKKAQGVQEDQYFLPRNLEMGKRNS